jgi:hypothetical protein
MGGAPEFENRGRRDYLVVDEALGHMGMIVGRGIYRS